MILALAAVVIPLGWVEAPLVSGGYAVAVCSHVNLWQNNLAERANVHFPMLIGGHIYRVNLHPFGITPPWAQPPYAVSVDPLDQRDTDHTGAIIVPPSCLVGIKPT